MVKTGAQIIIEEIINQGTDKVFGYPGGAVLSLYDELYKRRDCLTHITACHEQGATHAADGYARATGKVGVVFATSGPGATNIVTGLANAYHDSTPMVAITGNVATKLIGRDSFQEVDIVGITMPITKHNFIVKKIEDIRAVIREAFQIAKMGRPGPVLIDVPKDVQNGEIEENELKQERTFFENKYENNDFSEIVNIINQSERPIIYAGGGVVAAKASEELKELAEKIDAPVGLTMMGLTALPYDYERNLGMLGMHGRFDASRALYKSDLIIALGTRFSDRATGSKTEFCRDRKIIHIDIDASEVNKNIISCTSLVGDIKEILRELIPMLSQCSHREWNAIANRQTRDIVNEFPRQIIESVRGKVGRDTMVVTDVGQHQIWTTQYYQFAKPNTFITSGGLGTMGFGLGAAIGASIGLGKQKVVLFTSDGSFHMNLNELATAVSQETPVIVVIMNNQALGMVRQWQDIFYEERHAYTILERKTDFVKVAEAFGAKGQRVCDMDEMREALDRAWDAKGPFVIECRMSSDENVWPMIPPGGSIRDIIMR